MTLMTCFSDASMCERTKAAGWGGWAIREEWGRGRFYGGVLTCGAVNSNEAELAAMLHLLEAVHAEGELATAPSVIIQSDSVAALAAVVAMTDAEWRASKDSIDARDIPIRRVFSPLERQLGKRIGRILDRRFVYVRHVKGHANGSAGRSWVNAQCDREAKRNMQIARKSQSQAHWLDPV